MLPPIDPRVDQLIEQAVKDLGVLPGLSCTDRRYVRDVLVDLGREISQLVPDAAEPEGAAPEGDSSAAMNTYINLYL
jgi:hypothetical protein